MKENELKNSPEEMTLSQRLFVLKSVMPAITKTAEAEIQSRKGSGASYGYKYAELPEILRALEPHLLSLRIDLSFPCRIENGRNVVGCQFMDPDNLADRVLSEWVLGDYANPQETGKATSYYKRYLLLAALGKQAEEDNDAQGSKQAVSLDKEQFARLAFWDTCGPMLAELTSRRPNKAIGLMAPYGVSLADVRPNRRQELYNKLKEALAAAEAEEDQALKQELNEEIDANAGTGGGMEHLSQALPSMQRMAREVTQED